MIGGEFEQALADVIAGRAATVWPRMQPTFLSKVVGPHFEAIQNKRLFWEAISIRYRTAVGWMAPWAFLRGLR